MILSELDSYQKYCVKYETLKTTHKLLSININALKNNIINIVKKYQKCCMSQ